MSKKNKKLKLKRRAEINIGVGAAEAPVATAPQVGAFGASLLAALSSTAAETNPALAAVQALPVNPDVDRVSMNFDRLRAVVAGDEPPLSPASTTYPSTLQPHQQIHKEGSFVEEDGEDEEDTEDEDEDEEDGEEILPEDIQPAPVPAPIQNILPDPEELEVDEAWETEKENTVNSVQEGEQQQEIANPNIVVQQAVQMENEMQIVKHNPLPSERPADPAHIVPESEMQRSQTLANAVPAAAPRVTSEGTLPAVKVDTDAGVGFHQLGVTVLVTLNLSDFAYMTGLKSNLSKVALDGQEFNLYSPFRKAGKKAEAKPSAEGVMRYVLSNLLDITDNLNGSNLVNIGKHAEVSESLAQAIEGVRKQIVNLFPVSLKTVVAEFEDADTNNTVRLSLSDIVNVRSWVTSSKVVADPDDDVSEDDDAAITYHNAVINLTVNSGLLYDTEEREKYILQVSNLLELLSAKRGDGTPIHLAVNMASYSLADEGLRGLFGMLCDTNYVVYSRQQLLKPNGDGFMPQTIQSVDANLLTENGDLFLLGMGADDEEETTEGAEEDGAVAAEESE